MAACLLLAISTTAFTPAAGKAAPLQPVATSDEMLCTDQMETEPDYDDLDAMPVSDTLDGGCLMSPQPIST